MTSIDRRDFLRSSTAGAIAIPGWLATGFGIEPQGGEKPGEAKPREDRLTQLRKAYRRAVAYGKPLLVFVVPADMGQRWQRGQLHGAVLNHGGRAVMFDLALCELACGTTAELRQAVPGLTIKGEPMMIVVEPGRSKGATTRAVPIEPDLSELDAPPGFARGMTHAAWQKAHEKHGRERNAVIASALREALAAGRGALLARDNDVRATLTEDEHAALDGFVARREKADDEFVLRVAAMVRVAAEAPRKKDDRKRLLDGLAAAAERVIIKREIPGSRWATSTGCGAKVEGETGLAVACGMGAVPPLEQRFLYFFSDS